MSLEFPKTPWNFRSTIKIACDSGAVNNSVDTWRLEVVGSTTGSRKVEYFMFLDWQGGHRIRISKFPEFSRFSRVFLTIFQAKFIHLFL